MQCLSRLGFITFDTDKAIHALMSPGGDLHEKVSQAFSSVKVDGYINRQKLSEVVFADSEQLQRLEDIIYPALQQYRNNWIKQKKCASSRTIAIEIPLFFEKPHVFANTADFIIATVCEPSLQKQRAKLRPGFDLAKVNQIISMQVDNQYRIKHADYLIDTNMHKISVWWNLLKITTAL
jgi:dephospho-CoA kinase